MKPKRDQVEIQKTKKPTGGDTVQVGFRLPIWLVSRIDALAEEESESTGYTITRTDMAARLLLKALGSRSIGDQLESNLAMARRHLAHCAVEAEQDPTEDNEKRLSFAIKSLYDTEAALKLFRRQYSELSGKEYLQGETPRDKSTE